MPSLSFKNLDRHCNDRYVPESTMHIGTVARREHHEHDSPLQEQPTRYILQPF